MTEIKINDKDTDAGGTHLQGYINVTYNQLVSKLGEPGEGDGYKVDAEWTIEWPDGVVATIYNYKDGPSYNGGSMTPVRHITNWHIGGLDDRVQSRVHNLISGRPQAYLEPPQDEPDFSDADLEPIKAKLDEAEIPWGVAPDRADWHGPLLWVPLRGADPISLELFPDGEDRVGLELWDDANALHMPLHGLDGSVPLRRLPALIRMLQNFMLELVTEV